jgi:hypothetical protein
MNWRWADMREQDLILVEYTKDEYTSASSGIAELRSYAGSHGHTTGTRLQWALENRRLSWDVLKSLSSWCNSEGKYERGVEPARAVSRAFFNGNVVPRLTPFRGNHLTAVEARRVFAEFASRAGIWVDRTSTH